MQGVRYAIFDAAQASGVRSPALQADTIDATRRPAGKVPGMRAMKGTREAPS
mgnify:CR=1 FL=1